MQEMTYEDAQQNGIDTSKIAVCRKLRNLAQLDRVKLDETEHRSGLNKHLFDYIGYCGQDVLEFVKGYLSRLQPYMIERRQEQETDQRYVCVVDNLYRVSVYIKVNHKQFEEVIVSFHEDSKRGIAKTNSLIKAEAVKYVPIFADSIIFALVTFAQNLKLTVEQQSELKNLLEQKFKVTSIKGIDLILDRVKSNLALNYNQSVNAQLEE